MLTLISIIFGALIGSFLNVCIFRLPKEESIVWPGSHCPHCNNPIKFYDNIPLVSYILLKGKCRHCHSPISFQYPLIEAITAFTSLILFMKFGPSLSYLFYFLFVAALIVITVYRPLPPNHPRCDQSSRDRGRFTGFSNGPRNHFFQFSVGDTPGRRKLILSSYSLSMAF